MAQIAAALVSDVLARVRNSSERHTYGQRWQLTCRAMSTNVRIVFYTPFAALASDFQAASIDWIARFEARYSRFIPQSLVGLANANAGGGWIEFEEEDQPLFDACDRMHALTGGIFDSAMLPLLRLWNWKADRPVIPTESQIAAALELCGWDKIDRRAGALRLPRAGMGIDLGGIGKEYAVDRLIDMSAERGITNVLIDIGQDLRVSGHPPDRAAWSIGLEEPDRPGHCWTSVCITNQAVATSGDYFRRFEHEGRRYGHILDPRTGYPVDNGCQSVNAIATRCVLAGALATAAFILGPGDALNLIQQQTGVEACITTDHARHQTRRFSAYVPA